MREEQMRGLMGLCVRAGQAIFGEESCVKALRGGQAAVLMMDGGISPAQAEKYARLCEREGVLLVKLPEGLLEQATGRPGKAMAVRPGGFAEKFKSISIAD